MQHGSYPAYPETAPPNDFPEPAPARAPLADAGTRLAAVLLDSLFAVLAAVPGLVLLVASLSVDTKSRSPDPSGLAHGLVLAWLLVGLGLLAYTIYNIVLLSTRGQSLGKRCLGIRIVRHPDGSRVGFVRAVLLRSIVNALPGFIPFVGSFYGLVDALFIFSSERRCIHDHIAGTMVVCATPDVTTAVPDTY